MAVISNKFSFYIAGGRLFSMIAGFILPVFLVRIMTKEEYGLTSQFLTLYTSIYTIAALGIHTNILFFCSSTSNKQQIDKYIFNSLFLLSVLSFFCFIILFIPEIRYLIFGTSLLSKYSDIIIITISIATIMNIISPLNTVRKDKCGALLFPGLVAFGRIGAIVYSIYIYDDIYYMFISLFIYQCIVSIIIIFYTTYNVKLSLDFKIIKEQLIYSLPFGISVALQLFSNYYDKFVCIRILSPEEYAIYGVAFLSIPGITQIYDSLCQVNIVNMSNSYRNRCYNEIIPQYRNFVIKTMSFSIPIIFSVSLYAEEIMVLLYTKSYLVAAPYFRLYSLTFLVSMLGAGTILRSMGKTYLSLFSFIITCIIGIPVTYFLVKNYGTDGAIVGALINILLPRIIQIYFEIRVTHTCLNQYIPFKEILSMLLVSTLFLLPLIVLKYYFNFNIWICILQIILYISIVYSYFLSKNLFIVKKNDVYKFFEKFNFKSNN